MKGYFLPFFYQKKGYLPFGGNVYNQKSFALELAQTHIVTWDILRWFNKQNINTYVLSSLSKPLEDPLNQNESLFFFFLSLLLCLYESRIKNQESRMMHEEKPYLDGEVVDRLWRFIRHFLASLYLFLSFFFLFWRKRRNIYYQDKIFVYL